MWAGNKLFQSTFIKILQPNASILTALEWTLLNSAVSLVGYYFAAFTVDKAWMGRVRLQSMVRGIPASPVLASACAKKPFGPLTCACSDRDCEAYLRLVAHEEGDVAKCGKTWQKREYGKTMCAGLRHGVHHVPVLRCGVR